MTAMPAGLKARVVADCKSAAVTLTTARPWQAKAKRAAEPTTNPQVRAFLRISQEEELNAQKRSDLQRHRGALRTRHFLDRERDKVRKYSIETGYDERTGAYRLAPLEPWTGPKGSMKLYQRLMFGDAVALGDVKGGHLGIVEWMRDEGLAGVDDNGNVLPLSDASAPERRAYPGAPVRDSKAKVGHSLRDLGRGLVLAAITNLMRHKPVSKIGPRKLAFAERRGGIALSAYVVATEANAIKGKRSDLGEYKYLSVSTVRKWIKNLIAGGDIFEAEAPRAVRVNRSWKTLPRVFEKRITDWSAVPLDTLDNPATWEQMEAARAASERMAA